VALTLTFLRRTRGDTERNVRVATLGWKPEFNHLTTTIAHPYRWEENLAVKRRVR
jgi:hypothetical protein